LRAVRSVDKHIAQLELGCVTSIALYRVRSGRASCAPGAKSEKVPVVQPKLVYSLDADQFDAIQRIVRHADVTNPNATTALAKKVAATMWAYRDTQYRDAITFREGLDQLRALWRLAVQSDPPVGLIRARLKELPPDLLTEIEKRAETIWPEKNWFAEEQALVDEPAPSMCRGWLADLPANKLLAILPRSIGNGGMLVPGRMRKSGRRSRPSSSNSGNYPRLRAPLQIGRKRDNQNRSHRGPASRRRRPGAHFVPRRRLDPGDRATANPGTQRQDAVRRPGSSSFRVA
jgi:hypothetical protein